jgi:hypothetical protein
MGTGVVQTLKYAVCCIFRQWAQQPSQFFYVKEGCALASIIFLVAYRAGLTFFGWHKPSEFSFRLKFVLCNTKVYPVCIMIVHFLFQESLVVQVPLTATIGTAACSCQNILECIASILLASTAVARQAWATGFIDSFTAKLTCHTHTQKKFSTLPPQRGAFTHVHQKIPIG